MIALHGTWLPETPPHAALGGCFFLWAETTDRLPAARQRGRPPTVRPHPRAAASSAIVAALAELGLELPATATATQAQMLLPSRGSEPLPSAQLLLEPSDEGAGPTTLKSWQTPGFGLQPRDTLSLLMALPARDQSPSSIIVGNDLSFWRLVARFQLSLLARQRFLPALDSLPTDGPTSAHYRASWQPFLADPADRARLRKLIDGMPPACRAVSREGAANAPPSPETLLQHFLATATDHCVREWAAADQARRGRRPLRPELRWRDGLTSSDAALGGDKGTWQPLADQINQWLASLQDDAEAAFRLCFRLEAPDNPVTGPADMAWTLRYLLQASDDLSLLVPAEQVWRARGNTLRFLDRRFEQPQERLLAGLGKASRLATPVERSLHSARPVAAGLTTDEAYVFLRETALLLEESGFGVLVPQWWGRRATSNRMGARLKLSANPSSPAGDQGGVASIGLERAIKVNWELALGDQVLSQAELERLAALKMPLVQVRGQWTALDPQQIEAAIRFWERQQGQAPDITLEQALQWLLANPEDLAGLAVTEVAADGWLAELLGSLRGSNEQSTSLPQPPDFQGQLRPYQQRGFSWLAFLRRWGFGACLADDMGLGKTIQAIALLLHERDEARARSRGPLNPALLICPTSVVGNWQREVGRFGPSLQVMVHHGNDRLSGEEFVEAARQHDLVISTYALARRDADLLITLNWSDVILDEAQNIKNPSARQTQVIRKLPAAFRLALTGTPVENRLSELWSIMHFLNPGYLGSQRQFRETFARPIERTGDVESAQRLRALTQPFILRRVKTDPAVIQDLPDKLEMTVFCNLTAEQATLYQAVVKDSLTQIEAGEGIGRRGLVLATLLKLKQVCNHPALFLADGSPAIQGTPDDPEHRSGKLARLTAMLEEVLAAGDHALIFTQFAEMGELLKRHLQETFAREVLFLHGGTPLQKRDEMVARFQNGRGPSLFVLSLKAGGTGLNLTAANHVFHYDRWWNPAVENQATDRAFRIGQQRNVQVHKLICGGTLEDAIDEMIEAKKALAETVVGSGEGWLTELSTQELRGILTLRQEAMSQ